MIGGKLIDHSDPDHPERAVLVPDRIVRESIMHDRSTPPDTGAQPSGDRSRWLTISALALSVGAVALRVAGVPPVDLHGPPHYIGIMDPFCGGTRATYLLLTGDLGESIRYNPGVVALAGVVVLVLVRGAVGALTGRWLHITLRPRLRRVLLIGVVVAVAALWVRQQINADLLTQPWPVA
ncbi:DUF2752 domain-containing protein [Nocardia carnea]|uniref:DUF2752 domain-containing protein n=1 Tax=Nocardia carnea TaxID=37328 RepID=UPI00245564F6|nr:DUF2752 domain-containing protein [Nocardia carnea]